MSDPHSCVLKFNDFGIKMKTRNNPVKIGNNVLTFYEPYKGRRREFGIPQHVRRTFNKIAVSNNVVYLNGYKLNTETGEWKRTIKSIYINFLL